MKIDEFTLLEPYFGNQEFLKSLDKNLINAVYEEKERLGVLVYS
jgi:hypothetical protein